VAENQPANKNRMTTELLNFAARLRECVLSEGRVPRGPDLKGQNGGSCNSPLRDFNRLALELFPLQFQHNVSYQKICEVRNLTPEIVENWTQIPAVPTSAFKELDLTCLTPDERTAVFHSSGTTEQKPSRHFHSTESLAIYEASLWPWFRSHLFADKLKFELQPSVEPAGVQASACDCGGGDFRLIILTPPPAQAPHSSLVHMFETVRRKFSAEDSAFQTMRDKSLPARAGARFGVPPSGGRVNAELQTEVVRASAAFLGTVGVSDRWTLNFDAALAALNSSLVTHHPSLLLGTAFSFVHLLDYLAERHLRFDLPAGSRVMETGGYKNRSRSMPKAELHQLITERLGVPPSHIVCEYGMSELSSQAYDLGALASRRRIFSTATKELAGETPALPGFVTRHFRFPSWARVQIISPETGHEVADGETGLIRVFDLANVFSVMAIQTEDLGIRRGDGFELMGRPTLAEPRGCSLMAV
jgi:Acyl-protein synthetase, LuxE